MDSMKTYQDVEVMLPSKWAAKFRPKAFRPAEIGDWVFLPTVDQIIKLMAANISSFGMYHLILEPIAPDPKEWWPRWLKARWLFGGMTCFGQWMWFVSNAEEAPTPNPFAAKGSVVSWGYWDKSEKSLPLGERTVRLSPSLLDLSFIPEVEPKDACFKNPWLD
jgi:hypothetical protein